MNEALIFDPIERALWIIVICMALLIGLLYLNRAYKNENRNEKLILYGYGMMFIFAIALNFLFYFIATYFVEGRYVGHGFYAIADESMFSNIYFHLSSLSWVIGATIFAFLFERVFKSTKYLISLINAIFLYFMIMDPVFIAIAFLFNVYVINYAGIKLSTKSSRELKIISVFIITGSNFGFSSYIFISTIYFIGIHPSIIPIVMLVCGTLLLIPLLIKLETFIKVNSVFHWIILILFHGSMIFVILSFLPAAIPVSTKFYILLFIPLYIILVIFGITQMKKVKSSISRVSFEKTKDQKTEDIFKGFTRPQKLTEEEVSVSIEKKICLVCKGEVVGINFICKECKTSYCERCYNALTNLENVCWACDSTLDESKPSKPFKVGEEKEVIKEKNKK
ncbi:MAG: hypothetical protein ACFFDK_18220 [Promethearchaeota archaeon]